LQSLSPQPKTDLDGSFSTLVIDDNRVDAAATTAIKCGEGILPRAEFA
jgi:hypothetical protein